MWLRMRLVLTEGSGKFIAIVLMGYRDGEIQRHQRRWDKSLCTGQNNKRRTKEKWRGQCLEVVVTRSVSCLLFTPVGRLVFHNLVIFRLLVHHINLLVLPFLSLLEYTVLKSISRIRGGGSKNTSIHRRRRPGASIR